ncbi:MAG: HPr family phosphocarrier protein, partial [Bacillota bacterium]
MEKMVKIQNETGLHARPASLLVKAAMQFTSDINIEYQNKVINAKSI